jgi:iron complex transport system ATP-binding protein
MSEALLDVRDLRLGVAGRTLVDQLSFSVRPGEVWCLLGPNGSGKTTLLLSAMGLLEVRGGTVNLLGRPLSAWDPLEAARVRGFLPQTLHDAFGASVMECVMMGRHPHLGRWQWESESERVLALSVLAQVDLSGFGERDVLTLSGGERQRVALAALFAQETSLLLLDEPVSHLDLHHQVMVLSHLGKLAREKERGVLFSIHDLNLAARFASHAVILGPGGRVSLGAMEAVMTEDILSNAFGHRVTRVEHAGRTLFVPE